MWLSHKLADAVSIVSVKEPGTVLATVPLGEMARPNHLEFVDNARGQVTYMGLARVDDGSPSNPLQPKLITQIPLDSLKLPSGELRNKKSINLVYVRLGTNGQTAWWTTASTRAVTKRRAVMLRQAVSRPTWTPAWPA